LRSDDEKNDDGAGAGDGAGGGATDARAATGDLAGVVRRPVDSDHADEWTLVLTALGIPSRLFRLDDGAFALAVSPEQVPSAVRALDQYDRDVVADREERLPRPAAVRGSGGLGLVAGVLLAGFARLTGFSEQSGLDSRWFAAGAASASRIRAGEWWRAVTAMTLHADVMHLGGNVVAAAIFIGAAGRWLGWGVAAALIVLAGFSANVFTAYTEPPTHLSLGASTATFAALGLLVGLQAVHRWRGGGFARRRSWVAFGAGLGLLAMLGMGQQSDVSAHAFGIGAGAVLGLAAGAILDRPRVGAEPSPRRFRWAPWAQRGLAILVLAAIAGAWRAAL